MSQAGKDFSGQNLRGRNFKGQDLRGADFSYADIRGADFSCAVLRDADFTGVKAGLQKRWLIGLLVFCCLLSLLSGLTVGSISMSLGFFLSSQDFSKTATGLIGLLAVGAFFIIVIRQGLDSALIIAITIVTITVPLVLLLNGISQITEVSNIYVSGSGNSIAGSSTNSSINIYISGRGNSLVLYKIPSHVFSGAAIGFIAISITTTIAYVFSFCTVSTIEYKYSRFLVFSIFCLSAVYIPALQILTRSFQHLALVESSGIVKEISQIILYFIRKNIKNVYISGEGNSVFLDSGEYIISIVIACISASFVAFIAFRADKHKFRDRDGYRIVREISIALSSIGGTSFLKANLTKTTFLKAHLKGSDFRRATLYHTCFSKAKNLNYARVGATYLKVSLVREVLSSGIGQAQSFDSLSLEGINLQGVNLKDASFIGTNLNHACLRNANLAGAILKQTQLDGADLTSATLVGSYIEDWGITSETKLDSIRCEYVYMHVPTNEDPDPIRKPDNRNEIFKDSDFADFIRPLTDTLDLYHNKDVDPRALALAFTELAENNPETALRIVAMEVKGNGKFLLRAKTVTTADKSELSADYFATYNQIKGLSEAQVRALLVEKDSRIQSLEAMVVTALQRPSFYSHIERTDSVSNNPGGISQNVSGGNVYGGMQAAQGDGNVQSQEIHSVASSEQGLTQEKVIELLAQLESVLRQPELPGEVQAKAAKYLDAAKEEVQAKEPDKQLAAGNLKRMAETIETTSKTMESGKKIWETTKPILGALLPWLGVAKGFFGF